MADGRDMGTVVFPWARTKIYLEADPRERAVRRLKDKGVANPSDDAVRRELERLNARDRHDSERAHSPLSIPAGAIRLDTTGLTFEEQVERIVEEVHRRGR